MAEDEAKEKQDKITLPGPLGSMQNLTEETALRLARALEKSPPVRLLRTSQLLTALLGAIGLALLFVGIENKAKELPLVYDADWSIFFGLLFLSATGLLIKKLGGGE